MLIVSLILLQLLIFSGLIFMFRRIMTQNVVSATKHLEELDNDYTKKEKDITRQLEEVKQKSRELMLKSQEEAEGLKTQVIKETEEERNKILHEARTQGEEMMHQAEKSRQALISELEERINKEAVHKAIESIQNILPEQFKKEVHTHWVEEQIEKGFVHLERLRIPQDIQEIKINSAFGLTEEQRKILSKKLKDVLGREIRLKEEVEPKVIAGLIITIGSLVLDGSLKNRIQEQAKNIQFKSNV